MTSVKSRHFSYSEREIRMTEKTRLHHIYLGHLYCAWSSVCTPNPAMHGLKSHEWPRHTFSRTTVEFSKMKFLLQCGVFTNKSKKKEKEKKRQRNFCSRAVESQEMTEKWTCCKIKLCFMQHIFNGKLVYFQNSDKYIPVVLKYHFLFHQIHPSWWY